MATIQLTSSNIDNMLVSSTNPISGEEASDGNPWVYYLFPFPYDSTETTTYTVNITNTSSTIYCCILGSPGTGGKYKNWDSGNKSAGGGGGGSGGVIHFEIPNYNSSVDYTISLSLPGTNYAATNINCSLFSIYPSIGENGGNATEDDGGQGGNGTDCNSSNIIPSSGFSSSSLSCTFYGGSGGGGGGNSTNSPGAGGNNGTGTDVDGDPGNEGNEGGGAYSGGTGGAVTVQFNDGTSAVIEAGKGGSGSGSKYGESGPLPFVLIYALSSNLSTSSATVNTDQNIINTFSFTVNQYVVDSGVETNISTTEGISTYTINPFTYTSNGYNYLLFQCPICSYSNSTNSSNYVVNWSVPNDGIVYYFASISPGGVCGYSSINGTNDGETYTLMGGGGGDGVFFAGEMIPNSSYSYSMWDLSRNPVINLDSLEHRPTTSQTINSLVCNTYGVSILGADIAGSYNADQTGNGRWNYYSGWGSDGQSYNSDTMLFSNILNSYIVNGGGGGGGGAICTNVQNSYYTSGEGGKGGSGIGNGNGVKGSNGVDGNASSNTANDNNSATLPTTGGDPGETKYNFADGSSIFIPAGAGGKGGLNNNSIIYPTNGNVSWMMIYYLSN
jgi:hypothetical protein